MKKNKHFWSKKKIFWTFFVAVLLLIFGTFSWLVIAGRITFFAAVPPESLVKDGNFEALKFMQLPKHSYNTLSKLSMGQWANYAPFGSDLRFWGKAEIEKVTNVSQQARCEQCGEWLLRVGSFGENNWVLAVQKVQLSSYSSYRLEADYAASGNQKGRFPYLIGSAYRSQPISAMIGVMEKPALQVYGFPSSEIVVKTELTNTDFQMKKLSLDFNIRNGGEYLIFVLRPVYDSGYTASIFVDNISLENMSRPVLAPSLDTKKSFVEISPDNALANNKDRVKITAYLFDQNGKALPEKTIVSLRVPACKNLKFKPLLVRILSWAPWPVTVYPTGARIQNGKAVWEIASAAACQTDTIVVSVAGKEFRLSVREPLQQLVFAEKAPAGSEPLFEQSVSKIYYQRFVSEDFPSDVYWYELRLKDKVGRFWNGPVKFTASGQNYNMGIWLGRDNPNAAPDPQLPDLRVQHGGSKTVADYTTEDGRIGLYLAYWRDVVPPEQVRVDYGFSLTTAAARFAALSLEQIEKIRWKELFTLMPLPKAEEVIKATRGGATFQLQCEPEKVEFPQNDRGRSRCTVKLHTKGDWTVESSAKINWGIMDRYWWGKSCSTDIGDDLQQTGGSDVEYDKSRHQTLQRYQENVYVSSISQTIEPCAQIWLKVPFYIPVKIGGEVVRYEEKILRVLAVVSGRIEFVALPPTPTPTTTFSPSPALTPRK